MERKKKIRAQSVHIPRYNANEILKHFIIPLVGQNVTRPDPVVHGWLSGDNLCLFYNASSGVIYWVVVGRSFFSTC